jgi:hypothetical protein
MTSYIRNENYIFVFEQDKDVVFISYIRSHVMSSGKMSYSKYQERMEYYDDNSHVWDIEQIDKSYWEIYRQAAIMAILK